MAYVPVFTDIAQKTVLIIGGGKPALEKALRLQPFEPRMVVISPQILPEILTLPNVSGQYRNFSPEDLEIVPEFVIATGEDRTENCRISELCRQRRIPVNVVDDPPLCSFFFPALLAQGDLSIGICTAGKSPAAAVIIKENIQALLPENVDTILEWSFHLRPLLRTRYPTFALRRTVLRALVSRAFFLNRPLTDPEMLDCLQEMDDLQS